jgi:polygalacturonase
MRSAVILVRKYRGKRYQCKRVDLNYLSATITSEKNRADTMRSVATWKIYVAQTDRGEASEKHFIMLEELPPE